MHCVAMSVICALLVGATGLAATSCTTEEAPAPEVPFGAIRGELVKYAVTYEDGRFEQTTYLRTGGERGPERQLFFDTAPELDPGSHLDVWGVPEGEGLRVTRFSPLPDRIDPIARTQQRLVSGQAYRPRKLAFVLVDVGGGVNLTKDAAQQMLFGPGAASSSLRQYYLEASYGRQDLAGEVFGPISYPMTTCDTKGLSTTLKTMVPEGFDHYLWYIGSRVSACAWSGLAAVGLPDKPAKDSWYNGSKGCVVLVQEPGHNFGMQHSSSMKCSNAALVDVPNGTCTHNEYGDSFDPMGKACAHMNAYQKAYQGWMGNCNAVEVEKSGTFTLLPLELPCDGVQVLQIPMPKTRPFARSGGGGAASTDNLTHYYVELRTPVGVDSQIKPTVQIRVSGDLRLRSQRGVHTWLLDMAPATAAFEGLAAGGSFTDPAGGVTITVDSLDATKAKVRVELTGGTGAAPTCLDGSTLVEPGPDVDSCAAKPATAPVGGEPVNRLDAAPPVTTPIDARGPMPASDTALPASDTALPIKRDAQGPTVITQDTASPPVQPAPERTDAASTSTPSTRPTTLDAGAAGTPGDLPKPAGELKGAGAVGCGCRVGAGNQAGGGTIAIAALALWMFRRHRGRRKATA